MNARVYRIAESDLDTLIPRISATSYRGVLPLTVAQDLAAIYGNEWAENHSRRGA